MLDVLFCLPGPLGAASCQHVEAALQVKTIAAADQQTYAVAASLTEYLVATGKGDKAKLLRFVADGKRVGWPGALQTDYGISGVDELQWGWQQWAAHNNALRRRTSSTATPSRTTRQPARSHHASSVASGRPGRLPPGSQEASAAVW